MPINNSDSMLTLAMKLGFPVIVAARTTLGTINHTSLTVKVLRNANLNVRGVVMMGRENKENEEAIEHFAAVPIIGRVPHIDHIDRNILLQIFQSHFAHEYFES